MTENATTPEATDTPRTWVLSPEEFALTAKRAEAINARAVKRGFTGRIEVTGTPREIAEVDEAGLTRVRVVVDVAISGEAPSYNGWTFLAAVDSIETATGHGFVLRTAPGVEESGVDRSALVAGRCEHCNTTRANRRYTYLVRHENGETRQVGSTCIKDFTGWAGKPVFLAADDLASDLNDFIGGFASGHATYDPATVIAAAWAISRLYGWVPATATTGATPTRDLVSSYLFGTSRAARELRAEIAPQIPAAADMANQIITALLEGLNGSSDYERNMTVLLRAAHVESRHMGLVVSAVSAYERMTGETTRRKIEAEERARKRAEAEHTGTVGEKITLTGTVTRLQPVKGDWGSSMLAIIEGGSTVAKVFTTAAWVWEIEQGDEITVTATVKAHEDYQGIKQTALTRPKLIENKGQADR